MRSLRTPWLATLSFSSAALVISIIAACMFRYWHPFSSDSTSSISSLGLSAQSSKAVSGTSADTTAVVLNWSRFSNVRRIAKLLCSPELAGIFHTVLIWNNNPKPVSYEDFDEDIACSPSRLVIVNSPQNLYFQARFLACMSASTTFCYTQDDDYLVLPEVLQSLHARVSENEGPEVVHLLPAHERLSSELRYVCNEERGLQTSFAWLGHGTILRRSLVQRFLALMQHVNATEEQLMMADNYFSILLNQPPEVWFDQGIELGGGQAFTVGSEGELRNRRHILQASSFLNCLLNTERISKEPTLKCDEAPLGFIGRAPCVGRACVLETSIRMLPVFSHDASSATEMIAHEEQTLNSLSDNVLENYLTHSPCQAVDADEASAFRSLSAGREGDYILLDMLVTLQSTKMKMSWLVDEATMQLLQDCVFETSTDKIEWIVAPDHISCSNNRADALSECAVPVRTPARYFRVQLEKDVSERWTVYDIRLR